MGQLSELCLKMATDRTWSVYQPEENAGDDYHIVERDAKDDSIKPIVTGIKDKSLAKFICSKKDEYYLHLISKQQEP